MKIVGKVLVAMLVISAIAMALLENVEGGREMGLKEATANAYPHVLNEKYEGYKPKEDYECDGYKYKDKNCYEYGNCDKSPYNEEEDDRQYNGSPYKKPIPKPKEMARKYGVHHNFP
uniref:Seed nucellus-specific protein n=1 Tax=Citrullus lanatus TaxID=3654 RepID=O22351_CITLA|nr:seed nucellus-specific protein [Citrullus lanatus]